MDINQINQQINQHQHAEYANTSMTARLKHSQKFDTIAHEADLIDLEAKCRIADALETIAQHIK
ncbi:MULTISPECIES: hypothetical protein [unclassified Bifidobacterium]|uniref:hypothetical protein n=1 Tax=unclassified Bifidobacterium TaxID=2608897 RepID=UPI00112928E3|nr:MULTISPECIES: hypothetical protein [unclassified Bifidobacterium]TPF79334.1 hypothetical protein BW08_10540 [Bifidobacterium sp. UTCIF-24]TPF84345.1 hypothetical protein BW07_05090 [Bifidobacterium sp. UTCIF-36]TPF91038.1 hypothetical protein BW10_02145 [Bifidobacterium sp. UTBIF-56]